MSKLTKIANFLTLHWLAILLVMIGSWLRISQLPEKGILFGDSGRDLLVAAEAVENHQLPLLGIPSSVPRFRQGPLTIWLSMGVYSWFGDQPAAFYWTFALIGCLSLLAIYEFSILALDQKTGLMALAMLAVSPLAVAHSRMPYHTVPIVLTSILALLALTNVVARKPHSLALAVLAVALVFQHELSLFPLFLAIPISWIWGGIKKNLPRPEILKVNSTEIYLALAALVIGLAPQILSEIRDGSHQLTGFAIWLGYRFFSFFLPGSQHFGAATFWSGLNTTWLYWQRIFVVPDGLLTTSLVIGLLLIGLLGWLNLFKQTGSLLKLAPGPGVILMVWGLITLGYLLHGAPSEAYFPVYASLWPLLVAIGLSNLPSGLKLFGTQWLIATFVAATVGIISNNFWVDQSADWNYGPSVSAQLKSLTWSSQQTNKADFTINSTDPDAKFKNYLDNYIWLGRSLKLNPISLAGTTGAAISTADITIAQARSRIMIDNYFTGFHTTRSFGQPGTLFIQPSSLTKYNY